MVSRSQCMLQGAEICLDAAELRRNLLALGESPRMDSIQRQRLVQESKDRWQGLKTSLEQLGQCDVALENEGAVKDIEANFRTLDALGGFLDHDGPFIAAQVERLVRLEILPSMGGAPRS